MAAERIESILADAREGLEDPAISGLQQRLLKGVVDSVDTYRYKLGAEARAAERRARIEAEREATGERVGIPLAMFLAVRGVTTETRILKLVPDHISTKKGTGFIAGEPIERGQVEGLHLLPQDVGFAIKALNVLHGAASRLVPETDLIPLNYSSTLSEIEDAIFSPGGWVGGHTEAVLQTMVEYLPRPSDSAEAVS